MRKCIQEVSFKCRQQPALAELQGGLGPVWSVAPQTMHLWSLIVQARLQAAAERRRKHLKARQQRQEQQRRRQQRQEQQRRQQQQRQPPQAPAAVPHWMPKSQEATFALGREVKSFANMVHAVQQHREVNAEADVASEQTTPTASVQARGAEASQVTAVASEVQGLLHLVGQQAARKWHAVRAKQQGGCEATGL